MLHGKNVHLDSADGERPRDFEYQAVQIESDRHSEAPDDTYEEYRRRVSLASDQDALRLHVFPMLPKSPSSSGAIGYSAFGNDPWTLVKNHVTDGFLAPKPDYCESFNIEQYPGDALARLGADIRASDGQHFTIPRLCVQHRDRHSNMFNGQQRAAYQGAVMVNAAWEQHQFLNKPPEEFLNVTQAFTAMFTGKLLIIYGNYMTAPDNVLDPKSFHYHQYPLYSATLDDPKGYLNGRKLIRNAQDGARELASWTKDAIRNFVDDEARRQLEDSPTVSVKTEECRWRSKAA
jgi:hypothetical protein